MNDEQRGLARKHLETLLASKSFSGRRQLGPFFAHIVGKTLDGKTDELTQKALLKSFFGVSPSKGAEPPSDVRVAARQIREGLERYYAEQGTADSIRIDVPKGGYVANIVFLDSGNIAEAISELGATPGRLFSTIHIDDVPAQLVPTILVRVQEILLQGPHPSRFNVINYVREINSLLVYLTVEQSCHEWLLASWESGYLDEILGFPVDSIRPAEDVDAELRHRRSEALETCFTPFIDVSTFTNLELMMLCDTPIRSATVEVVIEGSRDRMNWVRLSGYLPDHLALETRSITVARPLFPFVRAEFRTHHLTPSRHPVKPPENDTSLHDIPDPFRLPQPPAESVFLYSKRIDNSGLVRHFQQAIYLSVDVRPSDSVATTTIELRIETIGEIVEGLENAADADGYANSSKPN